MKITKVTDIDKKKIVLDGCMITYTGIVFDLMNPDPDLICIDDIAHGLAFNSRWNGATKNIYTIAEHCLRTSFRFRPRCVVQLSALFHDAEEAYWGDMIKPLKEIIKINSPEVIQRMIDLRLLIYDKYNIPHIEVKEEDWNELLWDFENMILKDNYIPMLSIDAEKAWLNEYNYLKAINK